MIGSNLLRKRRLATSRTRRGWIGIDLGSAALKFAQVKCADGQWTVVSSGILPVAPVSSNAADHAGLPQSPFAAIAARGRQAACVLPMSLVDLHQLELPLAEPTELREMISQEIVGPGGEPRTFDYWLAPRAGTGNETLMQVTVLSLPQSRGLELARQLRHASLRCGVLDGLPFALARATALAAPAMRGVAQAVVDWGMNTPSLTIVIDGEPVYTRLFRHCGLQRLIAGCETRLGLNAEDCLELLNHFGVATADATHVRPIEQELSECTASAIEQIGLEIDKTLSYLESRAPHLVPAQLWLTGGGSTIRNIDRHLSVCLDIPCSVWSLPHDDCSAPRTSSHSLFAAAIALSALGAEL